MRFHWLATPLLHLLLCKISSAASLDDVPSASSLRGIATSQNHRKLPHPHPHHSSGSGSGSGTGDYYGCLDLNSTEQQELWPDGPTCGYGTDSDSSSDGNSTVTEYEVVDDDTSNNPYGDFVISKCETYENLWRWDLHMSCGGGNGNLDSCNCTFAEELFDKGLLVCEDRDRCPRSCPICSTCLTVLGCPDTSGPGNRLESSTIIYIIIGVVILLIVGLALFHSQRRKGQANELNQQLISEPENKVSGTENHDSGPGFEPPTFDSGDSTGMVALALASGSMAGVAAGGAGVMKKASDSKESDYDTEDCDDSFDPSESTGRDTGTETTPTAGFIATVRSEDEDAAPEDENGGIGITPADEIEMNKDDEKLEISNDSDVRTSEDSDITNVRSAYLRTLINEEDSNGMSDNQPKVADICFGEDSKTTEESLESATSPYENRSEFSQSSDIVDEEQGDGDEDDHSSKSNSQQSFGKDVDHSAAAAATDNDASSQGNNEESDEISRKIDESAEPFDEE